VSEQTIRLSDGRALELYVSGAVGAMPLIVHHGTPGARRPLRLLERAAHERGLRFVSASRPGYGGSTRLPGRSVLDVVADTTAVLAAIGASECLVAGHSGGGPHALACAAGLKAVRGTLVIAGAAPDGLAELDFTAGMAQDNVLEFELARAGEASLRPHLEAQRTELLAAGVDELTAALSGLLPSPDLEAMRGELGEDVVSGFHEALRVGVDGWVDDDLAFTSPWGFSVGHIQTPVTVWQGQQDLMVPVAHGRWLAQVVPGADGHVLPGEGHLSLVANRAGRMLDALIGLG
jgi:pimeloyl-ACP methyl ester carboxylesterase